ncbi:type II RES/Xre toxin-antitoxin system antitoxin [Petrimonas sp.]|uniref:type II RES/Xre toxin-antitoxin system antitoxin n=1 Tax=Petrimonas sp. TaxID=2023866 RepID=UPI003F50DEB8
MIAEKNIKEQHYRKLVDILGKKDIHNKIESPFDFIVIANAGVKASAISNFSVYFDLSKNRTAQMLNISEPTLYRWTKSDKNLERNFSVNLIEKTDLFLYGEEIFGNKQLFFQWLALPNTALGGMQPQELIEIPEGVSKVRDLLGRIEYGVYS